MKTIAFRLGSSRSKRLASGGSECGHACTGSCERHLICLLAVLLAFMIVSSSCSRAAPPMKYDFSFRQVTERSGATSWIFEGKHKPPLWLDGGSGFVGSVNDALEAASLPAVSSAVPERSSITGSRVHRAQYLWEDYPRGELRVERSLCSDNTYQKYDCIWKITVR